MNRLGYKLAEKLERFKKYRLFMLIFLMFVNMIVLPLIYIITSDISSGVSIWFILAVVILFILFSLYVLAYQVINKIEKEKSDLQLMQLEMARKTQNRFLSNMSHEIITPINTIMGLNEMNLRADISDEVEENSYNILDASKTLLNLINDILDLSKMEMQDIKLSTEEYASEKLFSDVINLAWIKARDKKLELAVNVAEDIPKLLEGDMARVKQILNNIISNAIKYTEQGIITVTVDFDRVDDTLGKVRISVSDTGIGIRQDDIKNLFDVLQRNSSENNKGLSGAGLSLAICKHLVDLMGGEISVDSVYQKGSTFTITLPQRIKSDELIGKINFKSSGKNKRVNYERSFEAPEARILIVDDNDMNLLVARKLLKDTLVQIDVAKSGEECLLLTKNNEYNVILMDYVMPGMNGYETLNSLRNQVDGFCKNTPVIALTANTVSDSEISYRKMGFTDYIAKPINPNLLESMLLRYIPENLVEYVADKNTIAGMDGLTLISGIKKRRILITADNVADIPDEIREEFDIPILHFYVNTKLGHFEDMREIYADSLIAYMRDGHGVKSEPPTVEEYEEFFSNQLVNAEQIIHICMSSKISVSYDNARKAAEGFAHVTVFDSEHIASGMGLMAVTASDMAMRDMSEEDIIARLTELRGNISTSFLLDSTEQLYRNGRLNRMVNNISRLFGMHVVIALKRGHLKPSMISFDELDMAYKRYIRKHLKGKKNINTDILMFAYSGVSKEARDRVIEEINKYQSFKNIYIVPASATITSNCGTGVIGIMYEKTRCKSHKL